MATVDLYRPETARVREAGTDSARGDKAAGGGGGSPRGFRCVTPPGAERGGGGRTHPSADCPKTFSSGRRRRGRVSAGRAAGGRGGPRPGPEGPGGELRCGGRGPGGEGAAFAGPGHPAELRVFLRSAAAGRTRGWRPGQAARWGRRFSAPGRRHPRCQPGGGQGPASPGSGAAAAAVSFPGEAVRGLPAAPRHRPRWGGGRLRRREGRAWEQRGDHPLSRGARCSLSFQRLRGIGCRSRLLRPAVLVEVNVLIAGPEVLEPMVMNKALAEFIKGRKDICYSLFMNWL
ncbi:uncharacterized protein LOC141949111 [Strix uralensis]|uniref:uncharacterized protein LOC141949111 n=1 Tax=Strix uralensis TaxID=36305 RepID=UPI003DA25004